MALGLLGAALAAFGCSSANPASGAQAAAIGAAQVQSHQSTDRPRLTLVERDGDPQRGLALAVYVGGDAGPALSLSRLLELRLQAAGFPAAAAHSSPTGFIVHDYASEPDDVARFVTAAGAALRSPVQPVESDRVQSLWRAAPPAVASSAAEAALAQCSGEMLLPGEASAAAPTFERLEARRREIGPGDVAFAVVGSAPYLKAGSAALSALPPWPVESAAELTPLDAPMIGLEPASSERASLALAIWGAPAATTVASAELLSKPDSLLAVRLAAASPPWALTRVSSSLSRVGGCLRADLEASDPAPSTEGLVSSAKAVFDELEHTLGSVRASRWDLDRQVLAMDSPRQAAAVAAWQALNLGFEQRPSKLRYLGQYSGRLADPKAGERLSELLEGGEEAGQQSSIERVRALEAGQSGFWMLLATPCGTRGEDSSNAGGLALTMQSLARGFDGRAGVRIEPWIGVDAMGLLAHSGLLGAGETPHEQAERVAEALARSVLTPNPVPDAIVRARDELLAGLGEDIAPGYWLALNQSSANHPSWLEPRGTWDSLAGLPANTVQLQRASFLRGRLRLASVGNYTRDQLDAGERRLLRLLEGAASAGAQCPPSARARPVAGTYRLQSREQPGASAVIALALPVNPAGLSDEARWTEFLLNRSGGWLEQALLSPGLVSSARARILGGVEAAALVIEVRAVDDKVEQAVAQVRGLLARLRAGAATDADAAHAQEYFAGYLGQQALDPRHRVVELWRGRERGSAGSVQGLRRLHLSLLDPEREVIVITTGGS